MSALKQKATSERGASITFALLLFQDQKTSFNILVKLF